MNIETKVTASLHSALAAAFPEIEGATKDSTNPHFKSKYADLTSVVEAIKPALVRHGLFFTQGTEPSEGGVIVETKVHHSSGESMSFGKLFVPANKNDAQGFGSALTYARRYSLMTAFGVAPEDDDGNAAVKSAPTRASAALVNEAQLHALQDKANAVGADLQRFCNYFGVASLKSIPAERFNEAMAAFAAKAKSAPPKEPVKQLATASDVLDDEIPY